MVVLCKKILKHIGLICRPKVLVAVIKGAAGKLMVTVIKDSGITERAFRIQGGRAITWYMNNLNLFLSLARKFRCLNFLVVPDSHTAMNVFAGKNGGIKKF